MPAGSVFKLAVTAIVVLAIIFIAWNYFYPFFFPSQQPEKEINAQLKNAEAEPGKAFSNPNFSFASGQGMQAKSFESGSRVVVFECNNPSVCCRLESETCRQNILWDERSIAVKNPLTAALSARCSLGHNIYICKIYFGAVPAQLEIKNIEFQKEIDLAKEREQKLDFDVKNSGFLAAFSKITVSARLFAVQEDGLKKTEIGSAFQWVELEKLGAGKEEDISFSVPLGSAGSYEIGLAAEGDDSGKSGKTIAFKVVGAVASNCRASIADEQPELVNGECIRRSYCESCIYGFECKQAWEKQKPGSVFETVAPETAYEVLEDWECTLGG